MITRTMLAMLLGVTILLPGCSRSGSDDGDGRTGSVASTTQDDAAADDANASPDPCGLLKPEEVEAAMGKLAVPPFRIGNDGPDAGGTRCGYRTADLREVQIGATSEGGAALIKMMALPAGMAQDANLKGKLPLPEFADVAGDWDEARIVGCCVLNALLGDAMVDLNFAGSRLTMEQAAALVDAALPRIAARLPVDGRAGVVAARAQDAGRPAERPVCSLLTRTEVEAILGPLTAEPDGSNRDCTWRYQKTGIDGKPRDWPFEVKVAWRGGFADLRDHKKLAGAAIASLVGGDKAPAPGKPNLDGPWDDATADMEFLAVRKDVLVRIDLRLADEATARKMAAALLAKM